MSFDDLLQANQRYAENFPHSGFDGIAREGVLILTCMDSRIDPRLMIGMEHGDVKILRSPGGRVSTSMLTGAVLSVQLLNVDRIMIVPHTKCAMAGSEDDIRKTIEQRSGANTSWITFGASSDQMDRLRRDVDMVNSHPLVNGVAEVGGFLYDVDTGVLDQIV